MYQPDGYLTEERKVVTLCYSHIEETSLPPSSKQRFDRSSITYQTFSYATYVSYVNLFL